MGARRGDYLANFLRSIIFLIFEDAQNTGYLYDITLIFDKCHHSWTAKTPDKYERDRRYLTYTFANLKFPVTEN